MKISLRIIIALFIVLLILSCAGYRRGIESIISEETLQSPQEKINRQAIHKGWGRFEERLELPNISIGFYLFNEEQTHHSLWFLILPYYLEGKKQSQYSNDSENKITIFIKTRKEGFSFNFKNAILQIDNHKYLPIEIESAYENGTNLLLNNEHLFELTAIDAQYSFTIEYNIKILSPDNEIKIDLSNAISHKDNETSEVPVIIFEKGIWSYWYT